MLLSKYPFFLKIILAKLNYFQKLQTVNATNFEALAAEFGGQSLASTSETQPPSPFYRVSLGKGAEQSGSPAIVQLAV